MERFIVQRALTQEVLSYDLKGVDRGPLTRQLSAVGSMTLTVGAAQATQLADDDLPVFQEWGTIVTLDDDGQIRFRGIVTDLDYDGPDWKITVSSMGTYPYGTPYDGDPYYGAEVDPADIVRKLWAHVQSFPDSDLSVSVVGTTPVRVGSFSTQRRIEAVAYYNEKVADYNAENKELQRLRKVVAATRKDAAAARTSRSNASKALTAAKKSLTAAKKTKNPQTIAAAQSQVNAAQATLNDRTAALNAINARIKSQQSAVDAQSIVVKLRKERKEKASDLKNEAQAAESADGGAYALEWWDAPDCGRIIDELAKSTPFDWVEEHFWSGDTPMTRIRIVHPRVGRRLSNEGDPIFQQGVNISVQLQPQTSGDDFANTVFGVGAGEGAGSIRRLVSKRNGRLRRVATFQSKDVKSKQDMGTRLLAELAARQETLVVDQITVLNHPNSPRGSYSLGDDINVRGFVPHFGPFELWHRIVGISEKQDGTTDLDLKRSDSFTYGAGVEE
jgi:hypothetical protein